MNFHVDRVAVPGHKHGLYRAAPLRDQPLQIGQHLRLTALGNEIPKAHLKHLLQGIAELVQTGLIDMHKLAGLVQLIDHLRGMLDEIAIPRLQPADIFHPLLDLFERDAQVRRHLIEGVGQLFDFIAGLEIQLLIQPSASDPLHSFMQQSDRTGDASRDGQARE